MIEREKMSIEVNAFGRPMTLTFDVEPMEPDDDGRERAKVIFESGLEIVCYPVALEDLEMHFDPEAGPDEEP